MDVQLSEKLDRWCDSSARSCSSSKSVAQCLQLDLLLFFSPDAKRENQNRGAHRVRLRRLEQVASLFIFLYLFHVAYFNSSSDGASSSSKSSHDKLEPEVYKTRKDENFTEYFKIHKNQVGIQSME